MGWLKKIFDYWHLSLLEVKTKKCFSESINNSIVGEQWMRQFMQRHSKEVSLRKPEATSLSHPTSFNRTNISNLFANLKEASSWSIWPIWSSEYLQPWRDGINDSTIATKGHRSQKWKTDRLCDIRRKRNSTYMNRGYKCD